MKVTETRLPGVMLVEPRVFGDERGFFFESYQEERYQTACIPSRFIQDNVSKSQRGMLRGVHYQKGRSQAKLVQVIEGEVFDVAVDIREGSPHFGQWVGVVLSGENHHQLYIPEGFTHGFYTMSETAIFSYKCSDSYAADEERGLVWNDPGVGIEWPDGPTPTLAQRDADFPLLKDIGVDLPKF